MPRDIKVMVIGDPNVGKTCLLISYTTNQFPTTYSPTVFDNYTANAIIDNVNVNLNLWDTAGSSEFDGLRPLSFEGTDVFLICFDLTNKDTFNNINGKWVPEIDKENCSHVPKIIVGTKLDLRDSPEDVKKIRKSGKEIVSTEEGDELKDTLNAVGFFECSALMQINVTDIFDACARVVIGTEKKTTNNTNTKPTKKGKEPKHDPPQEPTPPPSRGGCILQ